MSAPSSRASSLRLLRERHSNELTVDANGRQRTTTALDELEALRLAQRAGQCPSDVLRACGHGEFADLLEKLGYRPKVVSGRITRRS